MWQSSRNCQQKHEEGDAMSARYWIAKYIEDPLRNEPRNIGVVALTADGIAARFAGENEEGVIGRRRLQRFKHADVYIQWIDYWRGEIEAKRIESIVQNATPNYYVVEGGHVSDTGADSAIAVCNFLFSLLVSDEPVMRAFELADEVAREQELPAEVSNMLAELDLLADAPTLHVRHPIRRNAPVKGAHATHKPSFSQLNGRQYIYETIDFNITRPKLIRERSGWMAYMFKDIKQESPDTETYSIIRPTEDDNEGTDYARAVLEGDSKLIDWRDDTQRKRFLNERQVIAERLVSQ
jgi:hypothetical protein